MKYYSFKKIYSIKCCRACKYGENLDAKHFNCTYDKLKLSNRGLSKINYPELKVKGLWWVPSIYCYNFEKKEDYK